MKKFLYWLYWLILYLRSIDERLYDALEEAREKAYSSHQKAKRLL